MQPSCLPNIKDVMWLPKHGGACTRPVDAIAKEDLLTPISDNTSVPHSLNLQVAMPAAVQHGASHYGSMTHHTYMCCLLTLPEATIPVPKAGLMFVYVCA